MKNKTLFSLEIGDYFSFPGDDVTYRIVGFYYKDGVRICRYRPLGDIILECSCNSNIV